MRLKAEIWVKAYIRRCATHGIAAVVARHGDDDAGAIFIRLDRLDGTVAVFGPASAGRDGADFDRRWSPRLKGAFVPADEADRYLERERDFDADVWIVDVEDRSGRHCLGDDLEVDPKPSLTYL